MIPARFEYYSGLCTLVATSAINNLRKTLHQGMGVGIMGFARRVPNPSTSSSSWLI